MIVIPIPSLQIAFLTWADNRGGVYIFSSVTKNSLDFFIAALPVIGCWEWLNHADGVARNTVDVLQRIVDALLAADIRRPRVIQHYIDLQVFSGLEQRTDRCGHLVKLFLLNFSAPHAADDERVYTLVCNNRFHCTGIVPHALVIEEEPSGFGNHAEVDMLAFTKPLSAQIVLRHMRVANENQ